MALDTTSPRSRRALLFGALGGAVGAAVGRASPVSAANGDVVHVGHNYTASDVTRIIATGDIAIWGSSDSDAGLRGEGISYIGVYGVSNSGSGVFGSSDTGYGVYGSSGTLTGVYGRGGGGSTGLEGVSTFGYGLYAYSDSGTGVHAASTSGSGVYGGSTSSTLPAIQGWSPADNTGLQGYSGSGSAPAVPAKTGIFGKAAQDAAAVVVRGLSVLGTGVSGRASKGRGIVAAGGKAQLRLMPSRAATHPTIGASGDLFLDKSHRLWFCKGTTTWVKLA